MFLSGQGGYDRDGQQRCKGLFLIIASLKDTSELRAAVRTVTMRQLGHWMMASIKICGEPLTLSGSYGSDGLPCTLDLSNGIKDPVALFAKFHPIPEELQKAFWAGGGHNTCGSEGPLFRDWGRKNKDTLRRPYKQAKEPVDGR